MSFVTSEKMLLDAQKGGYAVGAFNVENMEMVMAVIAAAEELGIHGQHKRGGHDLKR